MESCTIFTDSCVCYLIWYPGWCQILMLCQIFAWVNTRLLSKNHWNPSVQYSDQECRPCVQRGCFLPLVSSQLAANDGLWLLPLQTRSKMPSSGWEKRHPSPKIQQVLRPLALDESASDGGVTGECKVGQEINPNLWKWEIDHLVRTRNGTTGRTVRWNRTWQNTGHDRT